LGNTCFMVSTKLSRISLVARRANYHVSTLRFLLTLSLRRFRTQPCNALPIRTHFENTFFLASMWMI
jgi:hypothetical protein